MELLTNLDETELETFIQKRAGVKYSDSLSFDDLGAELTMGIIKSERGAGSMA